ncbi:MAG TPA: protein-methionine-sulfoxide reductase heme-binding subunit MsrQ [Gemmatimonadales bacterium]|nr:protein-methionine-sulfoxide reductase heme-binding subunit MsrQ [Gemmatimonadales bacterium]
MTPRAARRAVKAALFVACLVPLAVLLADALGGRLGAEPIRATELRLGIWGLTLLVATLSITPLRRLTGWNVLGGYRRMLGLFAFTYICLHFLTWFGVDQFFAIKYIGQDLAKRPYITVGFASFLLMIPLAFTSSAAMVRRLGKRWKTLHSLVYLAALGGIVHFVWEVKADHTVPTRYAVVLVALLALRFVPARSRRAAPPRDVGAAPRVEATPAA